MTKMNVNDIVEVEVLDEIPQSVAQYSKGVMPQINFRIRKARGTITALYPGRAQVRRFDNNKIDDYSRTALRVIRHG